MRSAAGIQAGYASVTNEFRRSGSAQARSANGAAMNCKWLLPAAALVAVPAHADEVFVGVYAHAVDTPLTLRTDESGADFEAGYRFGRVAALGFLGKPAPYVIGSLNSTGDTSFAGAGLSWKLGKGPIYARPELGLVIHDGPKLRIASDGTHTELGSRVLFEPGLSLGTQLTPRLGLEASWTHVSQGRIFNREQNPGIDMWGARLNWKL